MLGLDMYWVMFVCLVVDSVVMDGLRCGIFKMGEGVVNDVSCIAMGDI